MLKIALTRISNKAYYGIGAKIGAERRIVMNLALVLASSLSIMPGLFHPHGQNARSVLIEVSRHPEISDSLEISVGIERLGNQNEQHPGISGIFFGIRKELLNYHREIKRCRIIGALWNGANYVRDSNNTSQGWFPYIRVGILGRIAVNHWFTIEGGPTLELSTYANGYSKGLGHRIGIVITP